MFYYHGNKHYYLTNIFKNDEELRETVYASGLTGDFEQFSYTLADKLYESIETFLLNNDLSADEYYESEFKKYIANPSYYSDFLYLIQDAIYTCYKKNYYWYHSVNRGLYVGILKTILYGSIKHFFFQNRDKYLPQYDWYLINSNDKRKAIVDMLFREFDKLANVADAIQYYQDVDDIPLPFLVYLQEITGLTTNTYGGIFTEKQIRSLTQNLINVWRIKGSNFSIELFFSCMGIDCKTSELWFDRRLYDNSNGYNSYTHEQNFTTFGYYLTPIKPDTYSYGFSSETVNNGMYTAPRSSRIWDYTVANSSGTTKEIVQKLLATDYTFFKSNYLLINFSYIGSNQEVSKNEMAVYKELVNLILPVFIRAYFSNEYTSEFGNEQWEIFKSYDLNDEVPDPTSYVIDQNGIARPAELFRLFDVETFKSDKDNPQPDIGGEGSNKKYLLFDSYPAKYVGSNFTSGTYINVYDIRLNEYLTDNNINTPVDNIEELVSSGKYDVVGGGSVSDAFFNEHIVYYNSTNNFKFVHTSAYSGTNCNYILYNDDCLLVVKRKGSSDLPDCCNLVEEGGVLYAVSPTDSTIKEVITLVSFTNPILVNNDGDFGELVTETLTDTSERIEAENTLTKYYFKVNDSSIRIYPVLFAENNRIYSCTTEGTYEDESFSEDLEYQVSFTYGDNPKETFDEKYSEESLNLFESSKWIDNTLAVNELYDNNQWNGYIQYEYVEHTNPIQSLTCNLENDIIVTLI